MIRYVIFIVVISCNFALAQVPDSIQFDVDVNDTTCNAISARAGIQVIKRAYYQTDQISTIVDAWDAHCPETESMLRLQILIRLQRKMNVDELISHYITMYYDEYRMRLSPWFFIEENDSNTATYELIRQFDNWTSEWALQLIETVRYGSDEFLACALFTSNLDRFDELMASEDFTDTYTWRTMPDAVRNRWDPLGTGGFQLGYWQPVGSLAKAFGGSADLGVSLGSKLNRTSGVRLELAFRVRPMSNRDGLTILVNKALEPTTSGSCVTIGLQMLKALPLTKRNIVDIGGGIDYLTLTTKLEKPNNSPNVEDERYSINTYNVFFRSAIRRLMSTDGSVGLYASWNYAPFNVDKDLGRSIGDTYLTFGIEFRPNGK